MPKSPVVYSKNSNPILAWYIYGQEVPDEPASRYAVRMMAYGAVHGLIAATVKPSGLLPTYQSGSGLEFVSAEGQRRSYTEVRTPDHLHTRNSDHLTAEMRGALAAGWQTAVEHFENTASALMSKTEAARVIGQLIVPEPDDFAPVITNYMPGSQFATRAA